MGFYSGNIPFESLALDKERSIESENYKVDYKTEDKHRMKNIEKRKATFLTSPENELSQASTILACLLFFSPLGSCGSTAVVCSECGESVENEHDVEKILEEHDSKCPDCKEPRRRYNAFLESKRTFLSSEIKDGATNTRSSRKRNIHVKLEENVVTDSYSSSEEDMYTEESHDPHVTGSGSSASGGDDVYHPTHARYPKYSNRIERTLSYGSWDNPLRCDTSEAAEAGLFNSGAGRDLMCFYCGVVVPPFGKSDDAWMEHARLNSGCGFVKSVKGKHFINNVQEMFDDFNIEDSVLEQELASMEQDSSRRFRESQLAPEAQGVSAAESMSSQAANNHEPQRSTSNAYSSLPTSQNTIPDPTRSSWPQRVRPLPPCTENAGRESRGPRIPKRQVQAREVRARLDLDWAQKLISMDFSGDLVGAVIAEQLIYKGDDFNSFKEMLMATVEAKDMGERYPVRHYAMGLAQNSGTGSGRSSPNQTSVTSRSPFSSSSSSALALSAGATSWTETTPSGSNGANNVEMAAIESSVRDLELSSRGVEKENREMRDKKMCKICFENDANMVFLPCGHLTVCESCCKKIRECPVCRRTIQGVIKAFLS